MLRKFWSHLVIYCLSASVVLASSAHAQSKATPADFAVAPNISHIALSADGNRIAFGYSTPTGGTQVRILEISTKKVVGLAIGDNKLRRVQFEDGGDVLVTASETVRAFSALREFVRIYSIEFEREKVRNLLTTGGNSRAYNTSISLVSTLPAEEDRVIMAAYDVAIADKVTWNLYSVATNAGKVDTLAVGTVDTYDWMVDRTGKPLARVDHDPKAAITRLFINTGEKKFTQVLELVGTSDLGILLHGLSTDNRLVFSRATDKESDELYALDLATQNIGPFLRADGIELMDTLVDPWSDTIYGVRLGGLNPIDQLLSADLQQAQAALEATYPGKIINILSFSRDRKKIIFSVETGSSPPEYQLLDLNGPRISPLGAAYPGLKGFEMGQFKATSFKARDGETIPVYVTLPPGKADIKNAPTIIFPHGGPAARDEPRFDYWAQFMATRGYVVIQPQFRGSTGFGRAFSKAGYRQWGKLMQDDVSDAVAWSVKEGLSDPKRVCIVGASYGGYAALAGATLTPDLYRCAVAVAGVSDLPKMIAQERSDAGGKDSATVNYWSDHIGADDPAAMEAVSPRRLVKNVRAPILLIHGRDDTVVRFEQSYEMNAALLAAGKSVKFVQLKGEDHWLSRTDTREQMLTEIEIFLREHLGPGVN